MREAQRNEEGRVICRYRAGAQTAAGREMELRFAEVEGRLVCIGLRIGPPVVAASGSSSFELSEDEQIADAQLEPLTTDELRIPLRRLIDDALARGVRMWTGLASPGAGPPVCARP